MGRVKPGFMKRIADELLKEHGDSFTENFEDNKLLVEKFTNINSKLVRNRIAGYITKIKSDEKTQII